MSDPLPKYDEAVSDIRQTQSDLSFLRATASAVSAILNESQVENKNKYRLVQLQVQSDIASGERLIDGIQKLIDEGRIAKPSEVAP